MSRTLLMLEEGAQPVYEAHGEIRRSDAPWTFLGPTGQLEDGPRSGTYRSAAEVRITGTASTGRISFADFAIATVDEHQRRNHMRSQFNVAN